jgi:hypothetical protein
MRLLIFFSLLITITSCSTKKSGHTYDITEYGAVGDSSTLNTNAIQKAIDDCASKGGGVVVFPAGKFVTGTLVLRSNIQYHFTNGSMLIGSASIDHYNKPSGESNIMLISLQPQPAVREALCVLLDGSDVKNVSFTGQGIIDGNGDRFWDSEFKPLERPEPWINFRNASNISIRDVTFQNAPSHVLRFADSKNIVIDGIKISNHPQSPNTDGIDLVDSKDVTISNCYITTGDDAICLKSDDDAVENVTVTNCIIESDDAAIKFGTGSRTAIRYTTFANNIIRKSRYGISLFMLEGGVFEHNLFSQMIMTGGSRHRHEYPIFIDVDKKRSTDTYGLIQDNTFSNLKIITSGKVLITGRPEIPIRDLYLQDITIQVVNEADFSDAKKPRGNKNFPKLETSLDRSPVAAHITLGHITGLRINNVEVLSDAVSKRKEYDLLDVIQKKR